MEFSLWVVCLLIGVCGWFDIRERKIPVIFLLLVNFIALYRLVLSEGRMLDATVFMCLLIVVGVAAACTRGLMGGADLLVSLAFFLLIPTVQPHLRAKAAVISIGVSMLSFLLWEVHHRFSRWPIKQSGAPVVACSVPGFIALATSS